MHSSKVSPDITPMTQLISLKQSTAILINQLLNIPELKDFTSTEFMLLYSMHETLSTKEFKEDILQKRKKNLENKLSEAKIDLSITMPLINFINNLTKIFSQDPPGELIQTLFTCINQNSSKFNNKNSSVAADDLLELSTLFLPNDTVKLDKIMAKIDIIEKIITNTPFSINQTGFFLNNLILASMIKKNGFNPTSELYKFIEKLNETQQNNPIEIQNNEEKIFSIQEVRKALPLYADCVRESILESSQLSFNTCDCFLMSKHLTRLLPNDCIYTYVKNEEEYKIIFPSYLNYLWKIIHTEFRNICTDKNSLITQDYLKQYLIYSIFSFFRNTQKKENLNKFHRELSGVINDSGNDPHNIGMKKIVKCLTDKFNDEKNRWSNSPKAVEWMKSQSLEIKDTEKAFALFLKKEQQQCHFARILVFILRECLTLGIIDVVNIPYLELFFNALHPTQCEKTYSSLSHLFEKIQRKNIISIVEFAKFLHEKELQTIQFSKLLDSIPPLATLPSEAKVLHQKLNQSAENLSHQISKTEDIKNLTDQLDLLISQFKSQISQIKTSVRP